LAQQEDKVETLENMNSMSRQELQNAAAESERLRLLMYAEQRNVKEALKQKKEMNAHLRQSLLELRQESDTRALLAKKQNQELREKIRSLEMAREKEQRELDHVRKKELNAETNSNTVRTTVRFTVVRAVLLESHPFETCTSCMQFYVYLCAPGTLSYSFCVSVCVCVCVFACCINMTADAPAVGAAAPEGDFGGHGAAAAPGADRGPEGARRRAGQGPGAQRGGRRQDQGLPQQDIQAGRRARRCEVRTWLG
jgi:hypothetical protein